MVIVVVVVVVVVVRSALLCRAVQCVKVRCCELCGDVVLYVCILGASVKCLAEHGIVVVRFL